MTIFYTGACLLCQQIMPGNTPSICGACTLAWQPLVHACPHCANYSAQAGIPCGRCIKNPMPWHSLCCAGSYEGGSAWLIKGLKYRKQLACAPILAAQLLKNIQAGRNEVPQAVIPMPLHWRRLWTRGFNQSKLIAAYIGNELNVPLVTKGIQRSRHTAPLEDLDRLSRIRVMKRAFKVAPQPYHHVAIVDDVLTSGASAMALSHALMDAGVARVDLWVVAKTPTPMR